eukprot:5151872-Alexandrium_andersonii.AAC.1
MLGLSAHMVSRPSLQCQDIDKSIDVTTKCNSDSGDWQDARGIATTTTAPAAQRLLVREVGHLGEKTAHQSVTTFREGSSAKASMG